MAKKYIVNYKLYEAEQKLCLFFICYQIIYNFVHIILIFSKI
ncbi:hypothetical protein HMPREF9099_02830 [Lachnospiraceae bacterium oral taxon 082 str. F0431]|nr:hypothetical protein HMPREF9099_02830 [Lachnospiraceae bacterium oral taxon 082 str. F0431]